MLEKDPKKRIPAAECLQHGYFEGVKTNDPDYDYIEEADDSLGLDTKMSQINEEYSI